MGQGVFWALTPPLHAPHNSPPPAKMHPRGGIWFPTCLQKCIRESNRLRFKCGVGRLAARNAAIFSVSSVGEPGGPFQGPRPSAFIWRDAKKNARSAQHPEAKIMRAPTPSIAFQTRVVIVGLLGGQPAPSLVETATLNNLFATLSRRPTGRLPRLSTFTPGKIRRGLYWRPRIDTQSGATQVPSSAARNGLFVFFFPWSGFVNAQGMGNGNEGSWSIIGVEHPAKGG